MHGDNDDVSIFWRLGRVVLVMGCVMAAVAAVIGSGAIKLPGFIDSSQAAQASDHAALAAQRTAADKQWASTTCTNILAWKNELKRDGTSLDLGFGPTARIKDAISATDRLMRQLNQLGLPPGAQSAQAQAELGQLRSDIESRLRSLEGTASSVAGGNLAAIGTLLSDLENDKVLGPQIVSELSHVASVDLGLSLAETGACRQLVGIPI
ncbi:MAG TPA: hypothetical protein VMB27_00805 [Solirubrobacteraceae bacterium]|nr:hypothetical protein [Solirubrobacteraceae bacterium]